MKTGGTFAFYFLVVFCVCVFHSSLFSVKWKEDFMKFFLGKAKTCSLKKGCWFIIFLVLVKNFPCLLVFLVFSVFFCVYSHLCWQLSADAATAAVAASGCC
jgi:hypothetical protein